MFAHQYIQVETKWKDHSKGSTDFLLLKYNLKLLTELDLDYAKWNATMRLENDTRAPTLANIWAYEASPYIFVLLKVHPRSTSGCDTAETLKGF